MTVQCPNCKNQIERSSLSQPQNRCPICHHSLHRPAEPPTPMVAILESLTNEFESIEGRTGSVKRPASRPDQDNSEDSERSSGFRLSSTCWIAYFTICGVVPFAGMVASLAALLLLFPFIKRHSPKDAPAINLASLAATAVSFLLGVIVVLSFRLGWPSTDRMMPDQIAIDLSRLRHDAVNKVEIWTSDQISPAEIDRLKTFIAENFGGRNRCAIQIDKEDGVYAFRFVIKPGLEQDAEVIDYFKRISRNLSKQVFDGAPVDVHLCDAHLRTIRVVIPFDEDRINHLPKQRP